MTEEFVFDAQAMSPLFNQEECDLFVPLTGNSLMPAFSPQQHSLECTPIASSFRPVAQRVPIQPVRNFGFLGDCTAGFDLMRPVDPRIFTDAQQSVPMDLASSSPPVVPVEEECLSESDDFWLPLNLPERLLSEDDNMAPLMSASMGCPIVQSAPAEREELEGIEPFVSTGPQFRFRSKMMHLTYKGHLDCSAYVKWAEDTLGKLKYYSLVHELGTKNVGYAHTHVLMQFVERVEFRSVTRLDYGMPPVHPNIKRVENVAQFKNCWRYHEKAPVFRLVSEASPMGGSAEIDAIISAKSLREAVEKSGVEIKTIRDIQILRQDQEVDQELPDPKRLKAFKCQFIHHDCLIIQGGTGLGKTRFALAHFENPLLVSHMDDLKKLKPNKHDGIVFDDMSFAHWPRESCIHLVDTELPRTLNVKHGAVTIPAGMRRIFTTNLPNYSLFPEDEHGAIKRRVRLFIVHVPLF